MVRIDFLVLSTLPTAVPLIAAVRQIAVRRLTYKLDTEVSCDTHVQEATLMFSLAQARECMHHHHVFMVHRC